MFITDLRQLIEICDEEKQDGAVPIWDENLNARTTDTLVWLGAVTCTDVQNCMQTTVDGINASLSSHASNLSTLDTRVGNLEGMDHHTHANKSVLDNITNWWSQYRYLAEDGTYRDLPHAVHYQHVRSNGNYVVERWTLNFDSIFTVTDDSVNWYTTIGIDPAVLWGGGWVADGNNYVTNWYYTAGTQTLTLDRLGLAAINIDLSSVVSTDELVKVGAAGTGRYLDEWDFTDNGTSIEIKKQMSITDDSNGLMLDWDEATPWVNMFYWTDNSGVKGRVPNPSGQIEYTATLQNTVNAPHNLGKFPSVICVEDSTNEIVEPWTIEYTDQNNLVVSFSPVFTGRVYVQ